MNAATPVEELRELIATQRSRFGVGAGQRNGEAFEDVEMCEMYQVMLTALLDGPENDAEDLPAVRRLKAALDLDGIVVGNAHHRASQLLASKGYAGLDQVSLRRATDKLLFLSDRAFSEETPEEAGIYEMGRVLEVLKLSDESSKTRVSNVSRALYRQDLAAVIDKVDSFTAEALSGASAAFGLNTKDAAQMNIETYRQIATNLLSSGSLPAQGAATLEHARGVLQLSERTASTTFASVAAPLLEHDASAIANNLAVAAAEDVIASSASTLAERSQQIGLPPAAANAIAGDALRTSLRAMYDKACVQVRRQGDTEALQTMDTMVAFAKKSDSVLSQFRDKIAEKGDVGDTSPLTLTTDQLAARRLYGQYLQRELEGNAADASPSAEFARILELTTADDEAVRIDVCEPMLKKSYTDTLDNSLGAQAGSDEATMSVMKLAMAKQAVATEIDKYQLPTEVVQRTRIEAYKHQLAKSTDRVLQPSEKDALDAARVFLELAEADVRMLHMRAFGKVYEQSVSQAMGLGVMTQQAREALETLRARLSLSEEDAQAIFNGVVEGRLRDMMESVNEAWQEATLPKKALMKAREQRGGDVGDDPFSDGTGDYGILETPQLDGGVRGYRLMTELMEVVNFYVGNSVVAPQNEGADRYPVSVGNYMEGKVKEEIFGIFAWNAITVRDEDVRSEWLAAREHVGGILGLEPGVQEKVYQGMVSKWCNAFITQKVQDQGELNAEDIKTLTNWAPKFFGIGEDVTRVMVQTTNKTMLQSKVLKLLNQPSVSPDDVRALKAEVSRWDLVLEKDLELTKPQLRSLFRIVATATLEDPGQTYAQKSASITSEGANFGMPAEEAQRELEEMLRTRCKAHLVNAVGDAMQGHGASAMEQIQRLEQLAVFAHDAGKTDLNYDWEVDPDMRRKLVKMYAKSGADAAGKKPRDVKLLEQILGLTAVTS